MAGLWAWLWRRGGEEPAADRLRTGRRGERAAERFLRRRGHRVLARNVAYRQGEVDLVTLERASGTVCFVEVRSRRLAPGEEAVVEPEATVTLAKRRRVASAARKFLADRPAWAAGRPVRFDVVTVRFSATGRGRPEVRHYPAAFDAAGGLLA